MLRYMSNKAEAELGQAASAYDAAAPGGKVAALALMKARRKELEWQCLKQDTLDKDGIAIRDKLEPHVTLSPWVRQYNNKLHRTEARAAEFAKTNSVQTDSRGWHEVGWGTDGLAQAERVPADGTASRSAPASSCRSWIPVDGASVPDRGATSPTAASESEGSWSAYPASDFFHRACSCIS